MSNRIRPEIIGWGVVGLVILVGVVTIAVGLLTPVTFGWFAYQPLADATFNPVGDALLVSRTTVVGFIVIALGLIALAFLAGWRLARRRTTEL